MNVVIICERKHIQDGSMFRTMDTFKHVPIAPHRGGGWEGENAQLSSEDLDKAFKIIGDSACNCSKIEIMLVQ